MANEPQFIDVIARLSDLNRGQQTMITGIQALTEAVDLQTKQLVAINEWLREPPDKDGPNMADVVTQILENTNMMLELIGKISIVR